MLSLRSKPELKDLSQGSRIAYVRYYRGMTQHQVADMLGVQHDNKRRIMIRYEKEENHEIVLVAEKDQYIYQVFSTYSIKPEDYYINTEFSNDDEFKKYIEEVKSRSNYDYQTEVNEKDKILTLSSCLYDSIRRVVLHAKLK